MVGNGEFRAIARIWLSRLEPIAAATLWLHRIPKSGKWASSKEAGVAWGLANSSSKREMRIFATSTEASFLSIVPMGKLKRGRLSYICDVGALWFVWMAQKLVLLQNLAKTHLRCDYVQQGWESTSEYSSGGMKEAPGENPHWR